MVGDPEAPVAELSDDFGAMRCVHPCRHLLLNRRASARRKDGEDDAVFDEPGSVQVMAGDGGEQGDPVAAVRLDLADAEGAGSVVGVPAVSDSRFWFEDSSTPEG